MPIACKRFAAIDHDFWAHGVGAFCWSIIEHPGGKVWRCLYILVPSDTETKTGYVPLCLYPSREENDWASPGPVRGWDGNEDTPTLTPSIQAGEAGVGWHGHLTDGFLVDA